MTTDAPNYVFSMFAFAGFILVSIPFPWHLEAWNTGTCLYMAWAGVGCLNGFINSIVWNGNAINWAPVWCDISSRIIIGISAGIPAASLCINRRLYLIASVQSVTITKAEKRRAIFVDLAIGLGIPLLEMVLQYVVQGHRFNIYEDIGCFPMTYNTPVAYPLVYCWPVAIGLVSAVYCGLTVRALARRRSEFNQVLSANRNLNSSRYFRLMALASIEMLLTIPWGSYVSLYLNIRSPWGIRPWKGWADTHSDFSFVGQYPAVQWKSDHLSVVTIELSRWSVVICAFIFFGFFGFADEARKNYRIAFNSVAKKVGYTTANMTSGASSSFGSKQMMSSSVRGTLPVFIRQETVSKRDSFHSFSTNLTIGDVGGALDDVKEPYSPTDSSSSGSSQYDYDEKHADPVISRPEPVLNRDSLPADTSPARPDSMTIV